MKIRHTLTFILLTLCCAGGLMSLSAGQFTAAQGVDTLSTGLDADAMEDSIHAAYADSLVNVASESYRRYVDIKSSGEEYGVIFPALYSCYLDNVTALKESEPKSIGWNKCRNTLINLDPDMETGAFYYSSKGDQDNLSKFAQAYIDIQQMDEMQGIRFQNDPTSYPVIAYIAASRAYNDKDYQRAIKYFNTYFSTDATEHREQVYVFMTQACLNVKDYDLALVTLQEGIKQYPLNQHLTMLGIQTCVDGAHGEAIQEFLSQALRLKPNDEQLLNLQGQVYEDEHRYEDAIEIYNKIDELSPNKLSTAKRLALCYYNIAVGYFNEAINVKDEKTARKNRRLAKNYFVGAQQKLEEVIGSDPMATKYLKALGITYLCLEEKERFDNINRQLAALGEDALSEVFMPPVMTYSDNGTNLNYDLTGSGSKLQAVEAPSYSDFSRQYIVEALDKWTPKGEFETPAQYTARVNDESIALQIDRLNLEAQEIYIEKYGKMLRLTDLRLMPYDAANETFQVETSYGPFTLKVPLKDGEAERFKSNWSAMTFRSPQYFIEDDRVQIASITVQSPDGKSYTYDNSRAAAYNQSTVKVDYDGILTAMKHADKDVAVSTKPASGNEIVVTKKSDVDVNIPTTNKTAANKFALIIANENYTNVAKVQSALHDGEVFAEYCEKTLGLPKQNIRIIKDATFGRMMGEIEQFQNTINSYNGAGEAFVYYAGHGLPDERTKKAYLLPIDGVPTMTSTNVSLDDFYKKLGEMNAREVVMFVDACFSGNQRDGSMLYDGRSVGIAHQEAKATGNMYVLTAASGQETALPYPEKNHGLFTYYVLKKLQESKGNVTLQELSDYVIDNVKKQSNVVNKKQQTPVVTLSGNMVDTWRKTKLAP